MSIIIPPTVKSEVIVDACTITPSKQQVWYRKGSIKACKYVQPPDVNFYMTSDKGHMVPYAIGKQILRTNKAEFICKERDFDSPLSDIKVLAYQVKAFKEAASNLYNAGSVLLNFPTGFGKTFISVLLWSLTGYHGMVLFNFEILVEQWKSSISKCFGDKVRIVEVSLNPKKNEIVFDGRPTIFICMIDRVRKIPFHVLNKINTCILDEGHRLCTLTPIESILSLNVQKLIIATATPDRPDNMHKMLELLVDVNNHIEVLPTKPFTIYEVHTKFDLVGDDYCSKYKNASVNTARNKLICKLINKSCKDNKVMVLTNLIDHVNTLYDMTFDSISGVEKYCSNMKTIQNYKVLIGTIPKVGTGYDESSSCIDFDGIKSSVLILCVSIKNESTFLQVIGRVMRADNPKIYILIDNDKMPADHIRRLSKTIQKRNGSIEIIK